MNVKLEVYSKDNSLISSTMIDDNCVFNLDSTKSHTGQVNKITLFVEKYDYNIKTALDSVFMCLDQIDNHKIAVFAIDDQEVAQVLLPPTTISSMEMRVVKSDNSFAKNLSIFLSLAN